MSSSADESNPQKYDIALSFAGEDRQYVVKVAEDLKVKGVHVFYDEFEKIDLWGQNLTERFVDVYMNSACYTVLFISKHYKDKVWARLERRAALARSLNEDQTYILPARFDDTEIEGLLPTVGYLDLQKISPAELSVMICEKVGYNLSQTKANQVPSPQSRTSSGTATFDYSSYDGRYRIGQGAYLFETAWSKASDTAIYLYNDPPSIKGVALTPRGAKLGAVVDASALDYSSRTRCPEEDRIAVLENSNGFYTALQIIDIKDDTRSDGNDELTFRYWILTDGTKDFSKIRTA